MPDSNRRASFGGRPLKGRGFDHSPNLPNTIEWYWVLTFPVIPDEAVNIDFNQYGMAIPYHDTNHTSRRIHTPGYAPGRYAYKTHQLNLQAPRANL